MDVSRKAVEGWQSAAQADHARRLSVRVDAELLEGAGAKEQAAANEAARALPVEPWNILYDLEKASGNPQAAREARQQAVQAFLAYRRDGGENQSGGAQLCAAVLAAVQENKLDEIAQAIAQMLAEAEQDYLKALLPKLQAILGGDRDPALAEDESLNYNTAAELMLLLEQLQAAGL